MWWKDEFGSYVNSDQVHRVDAFEPVSETWGLKAVYASGDRRLAGEWASEVDAEAAARRLTRGIDPSEL